MNLSGIYAITHEFTGKMYIGSAVNLKRRWYVHTSRLGKGLHHNKHLQAAWNKYGRDEFAFDVIEFVDEHKQLISREQVWLDFFKPTYNTCRVAGSSLGTKHRPESLQKMSAWERTEEMRQKLSSSLRGRKMPPRTEEHKSRLREEVLGRKNTLEARARMSAALVGRKLSAEHRAKLSLAHTGAKRSEEARKNMSSAQKGRTLSDEHRAKISEAKMGNKNCLGKKNFLGRKHTPEAKAAISEAAKRQHAARKALKEGTQWLEV